MRTSLLLPSIAIVLLSSACATHTSALAAQNYRVVGTEPFWGVQVRGDSLLFTTLEDQVGKRLQARAQPTADGVRYEGGDGATKFALELTRGECSDGMSDKRYAYRARFRYAGTDYSGCAEESP